MCFLMKFIYLWIQPILAVKPWSNLKPCHICYSCRSYLCNSCYIWGIFFYFRQNYVQLQNILDSNGVFKLKQTHGVKFWMNVQWKLVSQLSDFIVKGSLASWIFPRWNNQSIVCLTSRTFCMSWVCKSENRWNVGWGNLFKTLESNNK